MRIKGKITKLLGGFYYVAAEDGGVYETRARGIFRHLNQKPVVGDLVEITVDEAHRLSSVETILPRKNSILRPPIANVDQILMFIPTANPRFNLLLVDKMLAYYEYKQVEIYPVISKVDIDSDVGGELAELYSNSGYEVFKLSEFDDTSVEAIASLLPHKTTALSGVSGSGKTTFLNRVLNLNLETGSVSEKTNRGKHTTRHTEIFKGPEDMYLFDTPGFSSMEISEIESRSLDLYFREFSNYRPHCKFLDCTHRAEPDCAVRAASESGAISRSRFDNYLKIFEDLSEKESSKWR
ncbi:MAG: ribosome small subunit-dependent GTPase A [Peptoniphilus sp.]|nr:ribosome small subunit-dependent GTPase A [Peptoniphilus sp.]MDD7362948.1 ribosome small subunit-dependent GTPase A [Bacillota bacterium]MDY6044188.1 ribosome small subunit-dependent GTPase A [Peptoniphilus sp.]